MIDDFIEPPEPTIEEERDFYKRENSQLRARLADVTQERDKYVNLLHADTAHVLALESQCQKMRDALTAQINGDDPEDYFNIQFPPTSGVGPALEWFATLRAAGKTPLDLELLNRVSLILAAVQDSEFGGIECKDVNGQNWFDARAALLKSLSPSPNPAK